MPVQYVLRPTRDTPENSLYHFGILGMKWGKRNGPPYPLDSDQKSDAEKHRRKSSGVKNGRPRPRLSKNAKKAIMIGAGVAAAGLAAYGLYRLHGKTCRVGISAGHDALKDIKKQSEAMFSQQLSDTLSDVERITKNNVVPKMPQESLSQAIKNVNPKYGQPGYTNNCVSSSIACYLRQMGYNVTGGSVSGDSGKMAGDTIQSAVEKCFKGARVTEGATASKFGRSIDDAKEMLVRKYGSNAQGIVGISWKGGQGGGHCFGWRITNGEVLFFNPQNPKIDVSTYWKYIDQNGPLEIARLDIATVIEEGILKVVE